MIPKLVLSTFTGAGLLDRGFEAVGYCVVSAGDILWGRDVRDFAPARHAFEGVIGGPPCPDFSSARRTPPTGYGKSMIAEFVRVVTLADPAWWLLENVVRVPDVIIPGYSVQRLNLNANECGSRQHRPRCFQFGSRDGAPIVPTRCFTQLEFTKSARCALATEGQRQQRRSWPDFCELQGLPRDFDLPGLPRALKYRLVGNGVELNTARVVATAIKHRGVTAGAVVCVCGCGRPVARPGLQATPACRKRQQRRRDAAAVTRPGAVTEAPAVTELVLFPPGQTQ